MTDRPGIEILTVGHSTQPVSVFMSLIQRHGVTTVADVRSAPYSRFSPQFNREALERKLRAGRIGYLFMGRELGARTEDSSCYENGRIRYARLAETIGFRAGIDELIRSANKAIVAVMCAEKEPLECHRTLLVARALVDRGVLVQHILPDASLEAHSAAMERLLDVVGMAHEDLFLSKEELIAEALRRQEARVAYVDEGSREGGGRGDA